MIRSLPGRRAAALLITAFLLLPGAAAAETELEIQGQIRARTFGDGRDFDPDAGVKEFSELRTRLTLHAVSDGNLHAYIQFQDSRQFGEPSAFGGQVTSGSLVNARNVDLHYGYVRIDRLVGERWGLAAGRFLVSLGNQRLFGAVEWHNIGRAWDGVDLVFRSSPVKITGYWLKRVERNDDAGNRDFNLYGANAVFARGGQIFFFYEGDAQRVEVNGTPSDVPSLQRMTAALYFKRDFDAVDAEVNAAYQFGEQGVLSGTEALKQTIAAYLITAEVGVGVGATGRVALGVDWASGDDDPSEGDFKAFNNLYYTGHKFRGLMDYFIGSNPEGLVDLMLRGSVKPADGWVLKADAHWFRTDAKYTSPVNGEDTNDVGAELDLVAQTTRVKGAAIEGVFGLFFPSEAFAGVSDPNIGWWGYLQVTGNFGTKLL